MEERASGFLPRRSGAAGRPPPRSEPGVISLVTAWVLRVRMDYIGNKTGSNQSSVAPRKPGKFLLSRLHAIPLLQDAVGAASTVAAGALWGGALGRVGVEAHDCVLDRAEAANAGLVVGGGRGTDYVGGHRGGCSGAVGNAELVPALGRRSRRSQREVNEASVGGGWGRTRPRGSRAQGGQAGRIPDIREGRLKRHLGGVDGSHRADGGCFIGRNPGPQQVWYRDGCDDQDDRYNDQQFDQRKP